MRSLQHVFLGVLIVFSCALKADTLTKLIRWTVGYRCPIVNRQVLNSGHGIYLELSVNAGKLFHNMFRGGLYGGWGWMDRAWATAFDPAFINGMQSGAKESTELSSQHYHIISASAELMASKKGTSVSMPGCQMNSFHNYSFYAGLFYKIPHTSLPEVRVYGGCTRSHYLGGSGEITGGTYNLLELRRYMGGLEFMWQPFQGTLQHIALSAYYQQSFLSKGFIYFEDGDLQDRISLDQLKSNGVLGGFAREHIAGARVGWAF